MAFYHTYRPQNFVDLKRTQEKAALALMQALMIDSVSHAYLFTGTHGVGKTSSARILAKAVNCEKFPEGSGKKAKLTLEKFFVPCNECEVCKSITVGNFLDVLEMDAASHRGIDDIRELNDAVRLAPSSGRKKVYIIDEVHMLTTEAFNALLKTLEEPPSHAVFILCTTELHKVPLTIQSRCTKVIFEKPKLETIGGYLKYIAESEKLVVADDALERISHLSNGAFRDAVKLLEQLSQNSREIDLALVESIFVGSSTMYVQELLEALKKGDAMGLASLIGEMDENGVNFAEFIRGFSDYVRQMVLSLSGVSSSKEITSLAKQFDYSFLVELLDNLLKSFSQQRYSPLPRLPLELALLKMIKPVSVSVVQQTQVVTKEIKEEVVEVKESKPKTEKVEEKEKKEEVTKVAESDSTALDLDEIKNRWTEIVRFVRTYNAALAAITRNCKPIEYDGKFVVVETRYALHKDSIEKQKNREIIEQALFELLGNKLKIKSTLAMTKLTTKTIENVKPVSDNDIASIAQEIFGA